MRSIHSGLDMELMMDKKTKDRLMALPPERRAKVINAAWSVVARRIKRNDELMEQNMRSLGKLAHRIT